MNAALPAIYEDLREMASSYLRRERPDHTLQPTAQRILAQAHENLGVVYCRLNRVETATQHYQRALQIGGDLLRNDSKQSAEWKRLIVRSLLGLGDAIMAGNHLHADIPHYRAALEHYREALPMCEQLVASAPQSAPDNHRLMQTCARIAAMLSEIGAGTNDSAALAEGFAFHERAMRLDEAALRKDPMNVVVRRNYAGESTMTAYAKVLAHQDLEGAISLSRRALEMDRALADADPNNSEARQDLAHDYYVMGRALQLQEQPQIARENYKQAIAILQQLTGAHPDNAETAYDIERAQKGLAETATSR